MDEMKLRVDLRGMKQSCFARMRTRHLELEWNAPFVRDVDSCDDVEGHLRGY